MKASTTYALAGGAAGAVVGLIIVRSVFDELPPPCLPSGQSEGLARVGCAAVDMMYMFAAVVTGVGASVGYGLGRKKESR
jgi:hypothetical protein